MWKTVQGACQPDWQLLFQPVRSGLFTSIYIYYIMLSVGLRKRKHSKQQKGVFFSLLRWMRVWIMQFPTHTPCIDLPFLADTAKTLRNEKWMAQFCNWISDERDFVWWPTHLHCLFVVISRFLYVYFECYSTRALISTNSSLPRCTKKTMKMKILINSLRLVVVVANANRINQVSFWFWSRLNLKIFNQWCFLLDAEISKWNKILFSSQQNLCIYNLCVFFFMLIKQCTMRVDELFHY